ncbi:unnamed protein product [Mytilus edulis]|uniref:Uncharacterized protein n=1 Tax=Mytilus edulis TaxID=6550 RepID=A0A8S3TPZ5_MYTED|nr:unnamed protein product [Mytilus edulis]
MNIQTCTHSNLKPDKLYLFLSFNENLRSPRRNGPKFDDVLGQRQKPMIVTMVKLVSFPVEKTQWRILSYIILHFLQFGLSKPVDNWLQIKHCICSCAMANLVERQYIELDFSQCDIFMKCNWAKIHFTINVLNSSAIVLHSEHLQVNRNLKYRIAKIDLPVHLRQQEEYIIQIWTKCGVCDDSCTIIQIEVPAIKSVTISTEQNNTPPSVDVKIILVYAIAVPSVIAILTLLIFIVYQKKNDGIQRSFIQNNHQAEYV